MESSTELFKKFLFWWPPKFSVFELSNENLPNMYLSFQLFTILQPSPKKTLGNTQLLKTNFLSLNPPQ